MNNELIYLGGNNLEDYPIKKIKIADTLPYSKYPFRVDNDDALKLLAEDIKENGLLQPIVVRALGFDTRYEILSGHRRIEALKILGVSEVEARVTRLLDLDAARVVIRLSFLQRENILPSERGKAYMLRNETLKKERYGTVSHGGTQEEKDIQDILAQEFNQSTSSIFRYIRLNYLIDNILDLVDSGKLKLTLAVDLSYLSQEAQRLIYQYYFVEKKGSLNSKTIKTIRGCTEVTRDLLEHLTFMDEQAKKKKNKSVKAVIKKYSRYFKNEQEFADRIDKLLAKYFEQKHT